MTTYDTEDLTDCAENAAAELMDLKDRIQAQGRMGDHGGMFVMAPR